MSNDIKKFILVGLFVSLIMGVLISPFASSHPDGLEWVAEEQGFMEVAEEAEPMWDLSPVPDYAVPGIENEGVATALGGFIGTLLMFGVGFGFARVVASKKSR